MSDDCDPRFEPAAFLDLGQTAHAALFTHGEPVWTALGRIPAYLEDQVTASRISPDAEVSDRAAIGDRVVIEDGAVIEPFVTIKGPAWIGKGTVIRGGAYLRENVIAGDGVVMGNSCEFKNALLFNGAQVPHFNYVGDSILGYKAHLGAGVILSNVRLDRRNVLVTAGGDRVESGLRKFGAIVGDATEIGCNAVLSPGSVVGRNCILYPGSQWRGYLESNRIVKVRLTQDVVERRDPTAL